MKDAKHVDVGARDHVLDLARSLAFATIEPAEKAHGHGPRKLGAEYLKELRHHDGAPSILHAALHESDKVTTCAAAYALYRLDPANLHECVHALASQQMRQMDANDRIAEKLLLAIGPGVIPHLKEHLGMPMVLDLIGAFGCEAAGAIPDLAALLGTANVHVALTLARIGTDEAVELAMPVLLGTLEDRYSYFRKLVFIALGGLGERARAALSAIRRATTDDIDPDARVYAAIALADLGDRAHAFPALTALAAQPDLHLHYLVRAKLDALGPA